MMQLAQIKAQVPFVDRLGDGKTPFVYNARLFMDSLFFVAASYLSTGSLTYPSMVTPPRGSYQAFAPIFSNSECSLSKTSTGTCRRPTSSSDSTEQNPISNGNNNPQTLGLTAHRRIGGGSFEFYGERVSPSTLPWAESSYFAIASQPGFTPHSRKCFTVRTANQYGNGFLN